MNITTPKGWRKGQTIFNFLEWLLSNGGHANQAGSRAADTFHMPDKELDAKWKQFLSEHNVNE